MEDVAIISSIASMPSHKVCYAPLTKFRPKKRELHKALDGFQISLGASNPNADTLLLDSKFAHFSYRPILGCA